MIGLPSSSAATAPVSRAFRQAWILRATMGLTRAATWLGRTNAKPSSSSAGTVMAAMSLGL